MSGLLWMPLKNQFLGYQVSYTRDTGPCILTMRMAFSKFKKLPAKSLKFVADGYTAYKLTQQQFMFKGFDFKLIQVIGLTNDDPVSTEYRWLKQIIERLNRRLNFLITLQMVMAARKAQIHI